LAWFLLDINKELPMTVRMNIAVLGSLFIFLGACSSKNKAAVYEYTSITRGSIEKTVSSTGTLNPVATVKVLAQMSGRVETIHADFNTLVKKGDILAELNTDLLRLQREQQYNQVLTAQANYELKLLDYQNQEKLAEKNLISEYELKTTKTNLAVQAAQLAAAQSSLKQIDTEINQYAYITSPINGIVLERGVSEGDSVSSSSNGSSTSIYTLAENLTEMQIESYVGELDISSIREGQEASFTLEALPGKLYSGMVQSKRLMPTVKDNVVSYNVIVGVSNSDGSLLPGMTCSLEFIEERRENVLLVPNAALRYQPTALSQDEIDNLKFAATLENMDEEQKTAATAERDEAKKQAPVPGAQNTSQAGISGLLGGMPQGMRGAGGNRGSRPGGASQTSAETVQTPLSAPKALWYSDSAGKPACIMVRTGLSNGARTEVIPLSQNVNLQEIKIILREKVEA
jgi:HlyD family secretion protein